MGNAVTLQKSQMPSGTFELHTDSGECPNAQSAFMMADGYLNGLNEKIMMGC